MSEWSYTDGKHKKEEVSFMVVESGAHKLPDGSWVVAGKSDAGSKWRRVNFKREFEKNDRPVVFSQITTLEQNNTYTLRMRYVNNKGF
jgi:hypothetical protein